MRQTKQNLKQPSEASGGRDAPRQSDLVRGTAQTPNPVRRHAQWWPALVCFGLAAAVLAGYWPVRRCDFLNFDDQLYVTDNPFVRSGLSWTNLWWAWQDTHLGSWHPLTWVSHMLDAQLFGLNAGGHHLTNLLFHTANTLLLFLLLQRTTAALWRSALVAALFGLHPLHVESVAWVSERKDVLSTFFFLLTLLAYVRHLKTSGVSGPGSGVRGPGSFRLLPSSIFYLLSLGCFALGLMSKPMLVTVPLVLLVLDYWPLGRLVPGLQDRGFKSLGQGLWEKAPFFALALADGAITLWGQHRAGAVKTVTDLPLTGGVANAFISYVRYVWKTLWPTHLSVFYPFERSWPVWLVAGAVLLLLAISALAAAQAKRRPWLLAGWLWYLITVTPVIGFIQVGAQTAADRYTYIPLIGLFLAAVWSAAEVVLRTHRQDLAVVGGVSLVALMLVGTRAQVGHWQSSDTLFRHALAVTPQNAVAHHSLGGAFLQRGQLAEAAAEFRRALQARPDHRDAAVALAVTLTAQGNFAEAGRYFRAVLKQHPDDAEAHFQFGSALGQEGRIEQAVSHYQAAVRLKPGLAAAQNNLANALQRLGQLEEAIPHYRAALDAAPDLAEAHNNLGRALAIQGKTAEAMAEYRAALRLKPDYAEAWNNLGNVFAQAGEMDAAITNYLAALRHRPLYAKAENSLGCALAAQGRVPEALEHFAKSLSLEPGNVEALYNVAAAYAAAGQVTNAIQAAQQAIAAARSSGQTNLLGLLETRLQGLLRESEHPREP